jgi:hypothetical protein
MGHFGDDVECVVIAVRTGKYQNTEFHAFRVTA